VRWESVRWIPLSTNMTSLFRITLIKIKNSIWNRHRCIRYRENRPDSEIRMEGCKVQQTISDHSRCGAVPLCKTHPTVYSCHSTAYPVYSFPDEWPTHIHISFIIYLALFEANRILKTCNYMGYSWFYYSVILVHVGCMVQEEALGKVFSWYFKFTASTKCQQSPTV